MLSRSISSVLKGKGREGLVCSNSSNLLASLQAASGTSTSTPSRSIHAGPSRALSSGAAYARSTKRLSLACTCRPSARDGIWKTSSSSAFVVQKAQLHASALRKQEARIPEIAYVYFIPYLTLLSIMLYIVLTQTSFLPQRAIDTRIS